MRLLALGVDHRSAPASVREALAFEGLQYSTGLNLLTQTFPGTEWIILSTCNRVEVYVAGSSNQLPKISELVDILANIHSISSETFAEHLISYHDDEVIRHLFRVAASIESLVLGEGQILGQVREAYNIAIQRKTVGPVFHTMFQWALSRR